MEDRDYRKKTRRCRYFNNLLAIRFFQHPSRTN